MTVHTDDLLDPAGSPDWLDEVTEGRLVLLDVRWRVGSGSDREGYLAGHLPGAVFVDLGRDLAGPPGPGGRHPLPETAALQQVWRRVGLDDGQPAVVYDGADGSAAARAWWLLRWSGLADVRVLDGGLARWTGQLDSGEVRPAPGTVTVRPGGLPTVDLDADGGVDGVPVVLLDARAPGRYRGEFEPLDPVAGHIPGARNLPFAALYSQNGRLRPASELRAAFAEVGVLPGATSTVVASCGSGITACNLVLAGRVAGLDLALYPGSYSQWCALGRPIETASAGQVPVSG